MDVSFVKGPEVQDLLDRVAGIGNETGDPRLKAIVRDLVEGLMTVIVAHDVSENELWTAVNFLQASAPEFGLIMPGIGLEHFMDLVLDAKDA